MGSLLATPSNGSLNWSIISWQKPWQPLRGYMKLNALLISEKSRPRQLCILLDHDIGTTNGIECTRCIIWPSALAEYVRSWEHWALLSNKGRRGDVSDLKDASITRGESGGGLYVVISFVHWKPMEWILRGSRLWGWFFILIALFRISFSPYTS